MGIIAGHCLREYFSEIEHEVSDAYSQLGPIGSAGCCKPLH